MDVSRRFLLLTVVVCSLTWLICWSCAGLPKADTAVLNKEAQPRGPAGALFAVDTTASYVQFTGYGAGHHHTGRFHISSGSLYCQGQTITAGSFLININSMAMAETGPLILNKLRPHLLGSDFFDAARFPASRFVITDVKPFTENKSIVAANYLLSGNLTLKNITRNISFPVQLTERNDSLTGTANLIINRNWWGLSYGSDRSLKNKFISEMVNIQLFVKAYKAQPAG